MELMATAAGVPLYEASGDAVLAAASRVVGGVIVPLLHMSKAIEPATRD